MMIDEFVTHKGERVVGERLQKALDAVADWFVENAFAVRSDDDYGPHVTEDQKNKYLWDSLMFSDSIRAGTAPLSFSLQQRIDLALTGECVPFL